MAASDATFFDEQTRSCVRHGPYPVRTTVLLGREIVLGSCPKCFGDVNADRARIEKRGRQLEIEARLDRAGIPKILKDRSFGSYFTATPGQRHALQVCREFANNFERVRGTGAALVLAGNTGTGKGHLAASIALEVLHGGMTSMYATAQEIVMLLRASWSDRRQTSELEVLRMLTRVDLLVIDEVGVQFGSESERNQLFAVIDGRYREGLPIVLTTNLTPAKLRDVLGQRIYSRLRENGQWVAFDWGDWRDRSNRREGGT